MLENTEKRPTVSYLISQYISGWFTWFKVAFIIKFSPKLHIINKPLWNFLKICVFKLAGSDTLKTCLVSNLRSDQKDRFENCSFPNQWVQIIGLLLFDILYWENDTIFKASPERFFLTEKSSSSINVLELSLTAFKMAKVPAACIGFFPVCLEQKPIK